MTYGAMMGRLAAVVIVTFSAAGLVGCGGWVGDDPPPDGGVWEAIRESYNEVGMLDGADRSQFQAAADELDRLIAEHPDAEEAVHRLLTDMRDDARRLAAGEFAGDEALDKSEQLDVIWSDLIQGFYPPGYD